MLRSRRTAALVASLTLILPSAALADSAGDNQYQDPLANSPAHHKKQQTTTTQAPPAPAVSSTPAPAQPATTTVSHSSPAQSSSALPRTGFPLAPVVALGAALIGAGLLIRRLT